MAVVDNNAQGNIGENGTGYFNNSGGTFTMVSGQFEAGTYSNTAVGVVNLSGAGVINIGNAFASIGGTGTGTLNMSGTSSFTTTNALNVGDANGSNGAVTLAGGTLTGASTFIGKGGGTTTNNSIGILSQSGGVFNSTANAAVGVFGAGGQFMTGGTYNASAYVSIGRQAGGFGTVDVAGGAFNQSVAGFRIIVGEIGTGVLNVCGTGVVNSVGLNVGNADGAATTVGIVNLDAGGVLNTGIITAPLATATSIFDFNGGSLRPTAAAAANGTFMTGLSDAYVYGGGAIINTANGSATIAQPLIAPTGNGVSAIAVGTAGAGYLTAPIVELTGGGGVGATAVANVSNGAVTGFTITNPGTGYTSAPTVVLLGGQPTAAAAAGTVTTVANVSGVLTKNGANTLTLSGSNTYTGLTTVNGGTLVSGNVAAIPGAGGLAVNSAAVNFNGSYEQLPGGTAPLTLASLTTTGTTSFGFGLSGAGADDVAIATAAALGGPTSITLTVPAGSSLTSGTYNLFTDAAGGLSGVTLTNTSVTTGGSFYTLSLASSANADVLTVGAAQAARLFYTGNTSNNLGVASNYTTDAAGTMVAPAAPMSSTDVVFTANTSSTANFTTTLGSLTAVNSLEFTGTNTSAGSAAVTVGGPGTLSIAANINSFAAGVGIVVDSGASADVVSANLTLAQSESFTNSSANPFNVSGAIGGAGSTLTLAGAGTGGFVLAGANTYTGGTNVSVGTATVQLGSGTALGNAANNLTVTSGIVDLFGQQVTQSSLNLSGGRLIGSLGTGTLSLTSTGAAVNIVATYGNPQTTGVVTGGLNLTNGGAIVKGVGTGTPVFTGNMTIGGATVVALADSPGDPGAELSLTGNVSGAGSLTLNDAALFTGITPANTTDFGTLYLGGANTYTGGTNIAAGRIVVTSGSALGTGPVTIVQRSTGGGGTLSLGNASYTATSSPLALGNVSGGGITIPNAVTFGGEVSGTYGYGIYNDNGANTLSGPVTLANANQILTIAGGSMTFSGAVGSAAATSTFLTVNGNAANNATSPSLVLSGNNTYTGGTNVTTGTVRLGSGTALGSANNALTVSNNGSGVAVVDVFGQSVSQGTLNLSGGQVVDSAATRGTLTLTAAAGTPAITIPTTSNAYLSPQAVGAVTANLSLPNGGAIVKPSGVGQPAFTGNLALGGATVVALADSPGDAASELTLTGIVSGSGSLTLANNATFAGVTFGNQADYGTFDLTAANTYTGGTNISYGRLQIVNGNALGTGPVTIGQNGNASGGTLQFGNTTNTAATDPLANGTLTGTMTVPNAITLAGAITGNYSNGIINNSGNTTLTGPVTLAAAQSNISVLNGTVLTLSGAVTMTQPATTLQITNGGVFVTGVVGQSTGVTGMLTKAGGSVLTLSGADTYTGGTNISAGTLRVNNTTGNGTGIGAVNILTGGTLGGSGTLGNTAGPVTVAGTITAGPDALTVGTLRTGAEVWTAGGTYLSKVNAAGSTSDELILSGLTFANTSAGTFNINVTNASTAAVVTGTVLVLADDREAAASNPFSPTNSAATLAALTLNVSSGVTMASGSAFALSTQTDATSGFDLVLTAAPEPTSLLLVGVAAAPLALGRRRRSRAATA